MIKYNLNCKKCKRSFDSWFASSLEFEKLKKKGFLTCIKCNSKKVVKSLMAPKIASKKNYITGINDNSKIKEIYKKVKEYQGFIRKNFKYVGKNFAYEARSMHFENKKNNKGIYGTATSDEIRELHEEGIKTEIIPWIKDKSN